MNLENFLAKFELIADATGAVARLRSLVLQLAVRGQLVPQRAADGDAAWLLQEIAERCGGRFNPNGSACRPWYQIPKSWRWVSLGNLGQILGGGTPHSENPAFFSETDGIPWLTPADLNGFSGKRIFRGRRFITQSGLAESSARLLPEGSVLFSSRAPIGYVAIAGTELATNQGFKSCAPFVKETNEYLYYYLISAASRIDSEAPGTTFREVSGKLVAQIPVALPPLAEQKRIVAKVDELMALCDRLEAQQKDRETHRAALARASLARFSDAPTPANLNLLFHKSYTIAPADIRDTILNLAVRGRLVPQQDGDEPARYLLERIHDVRRRDASVEHSKLGKRLRDLDRDECEWELPESWSWCRFGDLVLSLRYGTSRKCDRRADHRVPVLRIPNLKNGRIDPTDLKFADMPSSEFEELRLRMGDLLLIRSNGSESLVGRSAVAGAGDERFAYAGYLVRARIPQDELFAPYLHLALSNRSVRDQIERPIRTTSGVKNINTTEISNLVIPLPPLAEQRRIVAKVDQLMALVDELETQLAASRTTATKLLDAIVSELTGISKGAEQ